MERKTQLLETLKDVLDMIMWGAFVTFGIVVGACVVLEFANRWVG